ncbi:alpha/beta hydrolase [Planctomonas psychrotolerans]|uniref:alpha/beta hydrolase n=1 Tax=Planctomonas psychrotolerans TaxID=2528712 RepID=UPI001D0D6EC6|nr:alpha/beta hydrolase [Planctomonas psychrotolerans]
MPGVGVEDRSAEGPHGEVLLRVFVPLKERIGRPLVVLFPADGSRTSGWLPSALARDLDAAVVLVRSPLEPGSALAERVDTAIAALRWAAAHAAGWNASADRLGVVGDGPGADIVEELTPRNRAESGPHISRQVLVSPTGRAHPPEFPAGLPTALILTGEHDPALSSTSDRVDALKRAGVPARMIEYPGAATGWFRYPKVSRRIAARGLDDVVRFLRRGLNEETSFRVIPAWDLH